MKLYQYIRWRRWKQRSEIRKWLVDEFGCCEYCGYELTYETSSIDHVIPASKGGDENESNYALSCWRCNRRKSNLETFECLAASVIRGGGLLLPREVENMNAKAKRGIRQRQIEAYHRERKRRERIAQVEEEEANFQTAYRHKIRQGIHREQPGEAGKDPKRFA